MSNTPTIQNPEIDGTARWAVLRLRPLQDDDAIDFLADDDGDAAATGALPWSVLIVDDDSEVHRAIELALMAVQIHGRPLLLNHCHSAAEARTRLLGDGEAVDLVLLDVVMETADAGLGLLDEIRAEPGMRRLPVLLHTGQPGNAPERTVRAKYDISGYLTKSTVTRQALVDTLSNILGHDTAAR